MDVLAVDLNRSAVEIHGESTGADDRFRIAFRAANDCLDAGDEFVFVKGLGEIVVSADIQPFDFVIRFRKP